MSFDNAPDANLTNRKWPALVHWKFPSSSGKVPSRESEKVVERAMHAIAWLRAAFAPELRAPAKFQKIDPGDRKKQMIVQLIAAAVSNIRN